MLRLLMGVAAGAVGGFAVARALEARAQGVPVGVALRNWGTPVAYLKLDRGPGPAVPVQTMPAYGPDDVLPPGWLGDGEEDT